MEVGSSEVEVVVVVSSVVVMVGAVVVAVTVFVMVFVLVSQSVMLPEQSGTLFVVVQIGALVGLDRRSAC